MAYDTADYPELARLQQKLDLIEGRLGYVAFARRNGFDFRNHWPWAPVNLSGAPRASPH
jgi:hypothetical protein